MAHQEDLNASELLISRKWAQCRADIQRSTLYGAGIGTVVALFMGIPLLSSHLRFFKKYKKICKWSGAWEHQIPSACTPWVARRMKDLDRYLNRLFCVCEKGGKFWARSFAFFSGVGGGFGFGFAQCRHSFEFNPPLYDPAKIKVVPRQQQSNPQ